MQNLFEEIKVPQEELENMVNEKLDMIRKDSRKMKRTKFFCGFTAAAACITALAVFSVSNPVLAAQLPLIGHLFSQVEDKQPYYRDIDEKTVQTMPETVENANAVDGLKISLSEIYCNTEALYLSVIIESEDAFPDYLLDNQLMHDMDFFLLDAVENFDFVDQPLVFPLQVNGEYMDDHTFVGSTRVDFTFGYGGLDENGEETDFVFPGTIPESFRWNMDVKKIYTYYGNSSDSQETFTKNGPWSFDADVTAKQTERIVREVNDYAPNGLGITTAEKREFEILLNYGYDESYAEYEADSIQSVILDADGKYMLDKAGMLPIGDFNVSKIDVYYFPIASEEDWMAIQEKLTVGEPADFIKEIAVHHTEIVF